MLIVGEAAGAQEAFAGKPFVGLSGFYLDRVLKRAGLNRSTFAFHNVISCDPQGRIPQEAISHCAPYLDIAIRKQQPKAIVALGNTALRRLCPDADGIARHRGFVHQDEHGRWVVPTYHPSFLVPRLGQTNTSRFVGVVIRDIRRAVRIAREGFSRPELRYTLDPNESGFAMWIAEFERALAAGEVKFLSFDIETPYKLKNQNEDDITDSEDDQDDAQDGPPLAEPILRIAFSYKAGEAVTVPWRGEFINGIVRLLGSPAPKAVWNGVRFDIPVIESHGIQVAGRIYDFMWGFHMWQSDLPKSLEFAASLLTDLLPWKHTSGSEPAKYNAMDADAQLRCGLALQDEMTASGQWDAFERHMVDLDPLLLAMGKRGVLIDIEAQNELRTELEGERDRMAGEAQALVPDQIKPRSEYKKLPNFPGAPFADGKWRLIDDGVERTFEERTITADVKVCSHCALLVSNKTEHLKGGKKTNACAAANATLIKQPGQVIVYDEIEPFNPNSVQHLIAYAKHFDHPVPTHHLTLRDTLDKKAVGRLAKKYPKHPIYKIALTMRGVRKTLGTYVEGFAPDSEGLIHTTFGHHPSSLRLSSRNVNLQNVSHRGGVAYADRVRRTLVPRPGHVFVEADSSAIEAVMTGYFMGSETYIALAKKGVHDFLNCFEHDLAFDEEGIARSKTEFKDARDRNKIVVHGTSYGMTPYLMHMSFPDIFPTVKSAEAAQQRFFDACPGLREWQMATRVFAHKQTFLQNPWHYRHYFYDVFNGRDKEGNLTAGSDHNRCVSFLPQSSAAAFLKDNVLMLAESRFWPMPAIGVIHDSYCLEVLEQDTDEAIALLVKVLTRPIPEMNNLSIGCEVKLTVPDKLGKLHWDSLKKVA